MKRTRRIIVALGVVIGSLPIAKVLFIRALPPSAKEVLWLVDDLPGQLEAKDYASAVRSGERLLRALPEDRSARYLLACALAREERPEEALTELGRAADLGFDEWDEAAKDDNLASLREDPRFKAFVARARANDSHGYGPIQPTPQLEGVRTVERSPEGGLRYRLRLPLLVPGAKPARLVAWLHPSGVPGNHLPENLLPTLIPHGFGVLVPVQKDWRSWSVHDQHKLEVSLEDAATLEGVDGRKPVLMGLSAGGQVALDKWVETPGKWGGLVLAAAYPVRGRFLAVGADALLPLPTDPAALAVPIFTGVGDEGVEIWDAAEKAWTPRGLKLTVVRTPGMGHGWTLDPHLDALARWLDEVAGH